MFFSLSQYIITGSLSVAAEPKLHPCLVRKPHQLSYNAVNFTMSHRSAFIPPVELTVMIIIAVYTAL